VSATTTRPSRPFPYSDVMSDDDGAAPPAAGLYVPAAHRIADEAQVRALVAAAGVAQLVTVGPEGQPDATLVPILWQGDRVLAHLAVANPHARRLNEGRALVVVTGPDAYVSPSWYPTKAQHGRVVPTWNYSAVHLRGRLRVITDPERLLDLVTRLTLTHEAGRPRPWAVTDAPQDYVHAQLRAIVGVEIEVDDVAAKAKLSQNRVAADQVGVVEGLTRDGDPRGLAVAEQMRTAQASSADPSGGS